MDFIHFLNPKEWIKNIIIILPPLWFYDQLNPPIVTTVIFLYLVLNVFTSAIFSLFHYKTDQHKINLSALVKKTIPIVLLINLFIFSFLGLNLFLAMILLILVFKGVNILVKFSVDSIQWKLFDISLYGLRIILGFLSVFAFQHHT